MFGLSGFLRHGSSVARTIAFVIGGEFCFTKTGSGTQNLTGANTYTGNTEVVAGALRIGNGSGSGGSLGGGNYAGGISISSGGTFTMGTVSAQELSGVISGAGTFRKEVAAQTTVLSGENTFTGNMAIFAGYISVNTIGDGGVPSNLGAATSSQATLVMRNAGIKYTGVTASTNRGFQAPNGTLAHWDIVEAGTELTISGGFGSIGGYTDGGLLKLGLGSLKLTGGSGIGPTFVNAGTLIIAGATSLGTGATTVNSGGTLTYTIDTTGTRTVTVNAGGVINKGGFTHTGTVFVNNGGTINA